MNVPTEPKQTNPVETDPSPGTRLEVVWIDRTREVPAADMEWLADMSRRAGQRIRAVGDMRVAIVADPEMAAAHEKYSGIPGTTDVLTFSLGAGDRVDADVMVCLDEARRQAAGLGHDPRRELLLYCVHALLHCLGFDDHDDAAFQRMHQTEDALLEALGVGATFFKGARGTE